MGGWDFGYGGGRGGAGMDACGVDIFCIQKGGIGPFGSPVANGLSPVNATYTTGGNYRVDTPNPPGMLTFNCDGTTTSATCTPNAYTTTWLINGSQSHSINPMYPGLAPGDIPIGMDIFHCPGCAETWRNASGAANAAFIGTVRFWCRHLLSQ
jgi:hypothetical protein